MKEYLKYGNNLTSLAHLQDLPAVYELKKYNKIPNNTVFVPGHTGDFISGGHIPNKYSEKDKIEQNEIITDVWRKHYNLYNWLNKYNELAPNFRKKILSITNGFYKNSPEEAANGFEYWEWQNRQAKFIVNSVRVYEFFGFEWRIPLWDSELMDFWARVSLKYRLKKELYAEYLFERLFNKFDVDFRISKTHKSSNLIISMIKKLIPEHLKDIIKNRIIKKPDNLEILEVIKNYFYDNEINNSNLHNLNAYLAKLNIWALSKEI